MTEIRFIRRDAPVSRQQGTEGEGATDPAGENLNPLIRSIAGAAMEETELVILELQRVRDMLHSESERLSREIARYASLNRSLMATTKVIRESLRGLASTNGRAQP